MPGVLIDHADRQTVLRVSAGVQILNVEFASSQELHNTLKKRVELFRLKGDVDVAPVHQFGGDRVFDREFVFWGASGELPRIGHQRAVVGKLAFAAPDGMLNQNPGVEIALDWVAFEQGFEGSSCVNDGQSLRHGGKSPVIPNRECRVRWAARATRFGREFAAKPFSQARPEARRLP